MAVEDAGGDRVQGFAILHHRADRDQADAEPPAGKHLDRVGEILGDGESDIAGGGRGLHRPGLVGGDRGPWQRQDEGGPEQTAAPPHWAVPSRPRRVRNAMCES